MKKQWPIWLMLVGVVIVVLFAFNHQGRQETVPVGEIFPDMSKKPDVDIEYEFIPSGSESAPVPAAEQAAGQDMKAPENTLVASTPKPVDFSSAVESGTPVKFTIQILSSQNKAKTEEILAKVKTSGLPAYLVTKDLGDKGTWHRIYVGEFQSKTEAEGFLPKVKKDYSGAFVLKP